MITNSNITCQQCHQGIDDIANAKIICHGCRVGAPTQVKDIEVEKNIVKDINLDEPVMDFRPVLKNGRLLIHAPTQRDPRRFFDVEKLLF